LLGRKRHPAHPQAPRESELTTRWIALVHQAWFGVIAGALRMVVSVPAAQDFANIVTRIILANELSRQERSGREIFSSECLVAATSCFMC
jgi:hypothetical protein